MATHFLWMKFWIKEFKTLECVKSSINLSSLFFKGMLFVNNISLFWNARNSFTRLIHLYVYLESLGVIKGYISRATSLREWSFISSKLYTSIASPKWRYSSLMRSRKLYISDSEKSQWILSRLSGIGSLGRELPTCYFVRISLRLASWQGLRATCEFRTHTGL